MKDLLTYKDNFFQDGSVINLASVTGGQLANSPTAQSLEREFVKKPPVGGNATDRHLDDNCRLKIDLKL